MRSRTYRIVWAVLIAAVAFYFGQKNFGIDAKDEHGMSALMRAARDGNAGEVRELLDRGANPKEKVPTRDLREFIAFISWMQQLPESDIGATALHFAAKGGHTEVARLLLDGGAKVDEAARGGATALDYATWSGHVETAAVLLGAGAKPTPSQAAMAVMTSRPVEMLELLAGAGLDVNARAEQKQPPLVISAVQARNLPALEALIRLGADVNARDQNGWTALRFAHRQERNRRSWEKSLQPIIDALEAAGASDKSGTANAALFDAVLAKDADAVRDALRDGASANAPDDRGVPPLIYAAGHGEVEIVDALLAAGAQVNANPNNDTTPLIAGVRSGNADVVRRLLSGGANVNQADHIRQTPLQVASDHKHAEITQILLEAGAASDSRSLATAALRGNVEQVRQLLAAGADPNQIGVLFEAARGCNLEVMQALFDAGARVQKNEDGETPLNRAAGLCEVDVVKLLIERGADVNAGGGNNYTPLISAASTGKLENVQALIAAGADVKARDRDGKSVLEYAARYPEVAQALRDAGAE